MGFDVIIVGAGHNGLVTAAYLSQAGRRVLVLERRELVGGCAVTERGLPACREIKPRPALRRADVCRARPAPLRSDSGETGAGARTSVRCGSWVFQYGALTPLSSSLTPETPCRDRLWRIAEPAAVRDETSPRGGATARAILFLPA